MSRKRASIRRQLLAILLSTLAGFACDSPETPPGLPEELRATAPSGVRVLLVGIDGATFEVIRPLVAEGRLPNLARLLREGSSARLRSQNPSRSPSIWTTVATGHGPEVHGIDDFLSASRGDAERPALVASFDRRTLAVWNLVSAFDRSVDVIGWWVTWPAEPVNGTVVSDRVAHSRWQSWVREKVDLHLTSPPEALDEIRDLVVDPLDPPLAELEALVALTGDERREMLAARSPIPFHWPSVLKFGWCEQRTYEEIALRLLGRRQPDLGMVFLIGVDPVSHTTWHYYEPERFGGEGAVDPGDAARVGRLLPRMYERDDAVLGKLLERVDDDTVVIVVSDHGFTASGELPSETRDVDLGIFGIEHRERLERPVNVGMTGVHTLWGVLVAAGGPIVRGASFAKPPSVLDVTPTILALLGLPVGEDMAGRVLTEMIDPAFLAKHPVRTIPSYEGVIPRPPPPDEIEDDDETRRQYLKALGYVD